MIPGLILAGAALLAAYASSLEIALLGLSEARVQDLIHNRRMGARFLLRWIHSPAALHTTLSFLHVMGCFVAGAAAWHMLAGQPRAWVWAAMAAMTVAVLTYVVPRPLAKAHAGTWARFAVWPAWLLSYLIWPCFRPLHWLVRRWTRGEPATLWSLAELVSLDKDGRVADSDLLASVARFSDTIIREIMVPRTDMVTIALSAPAQEVRAILLEGGHSRVPVYEDTLDRVVGLLHVKDLVRSMMSDDGRSDRDALWHNLRPLLRATFFVPEVMAIRDLLREFQRRKTHMAIVVDEYGGTVGVVTLEDIIEELVGEIHDEYDVEERQYRVLSENKVLADGRVNVSDLEDVLAVQFPEDGGFDTLAGFLTAHAGYLPEVGAVIQWRNFRFKVKEADARRIATVEIERVATSA